MVATAGVSGHGDREGWPFLRPDPGCSAGLARRELRNNAWARHSSSGRDRLCSKRVAQPPGQHVSDHLIGRHQTATLIGMLLREPKAIKIFLSYAGADKSAAHDLWCRLSKALSVSATLEWELWSFEEQVLLGEDFDEKIRAALAAADIGLCALSLDFLTSAYIQNVELPALLDPPNGKRLAPVLLSELPATVGLRGLSGRQIYGFDDPYWNGRDPHRRTRWANGLADELHRLANRYGLGE
jgi:hypothetical protein